MSKIEQSLIIEATPAAIWQVLGDLAQAAAYIPGIVQARVEGNQRICIDAEGHEIREQISDYSAEKMSYHFEHTQSPLPVKVSRGRFSVLPAEKGAEVFMVWEVAFADPALATQMVPMLEGAAQMTLANLRQRVLAITPA